MEHNFTIQEGQSQLDFYNSIKEMRQVLIELAQQSPLNTRIIETGYAVIQTLLGETLVIQRSTKGGQAHQWEFPGGKRELDHHSITATTMTEALEEVGIVLALEPAVAKLVLRPEVALKTSYAVDIFKRNGLTVATALDLPSRIGFRYSFESTPSSPLLLYMSSITRFLIEEAIDVRLSDEHEEYQWAQAEQLPHLDWARDIYREAALSTLPALADCNPVEKAQTMEWINKLRERMHSPRQI